MNEKQLEKQQCIIKTGFLHKKDKYNMNINSIWYVIPVDVFFSGYNYWIHFGH